MLIYSNIPVFFSSTWTFQKTIYYFITVVYIKEELDEDALDVNIPSTNEGKILQEVCYD